MSTVTRQDRAGVYERVSTADQSAARQSYENAEAIAANDWTLTATYAADSGKSASRFAHHGGRDDHARLVSDVTSGQLDILVMHEVSRTDRQTERWAGLVALCRERGVLIHITSKRRTYDPREWDDRESLLRQGIAAEGESEGLSMRIRSGKAEGVRAGRPQGGIAYGVHRVRDPEKTRHAWLRDEPDTQTGPVVRRIILAIGAGEPYAHIAAALTADQVPTPSGAPQWNASTVTKIAANPVYAQTTPPLVTTAQSGAAIARIQRGRRSGERPARQVHRYSGCLACHRCGAPVRGLARSDGARYTCKAGHVSIAAAEVDSWIDACAVERLSRPDLASLIPSADSGAAAAHWADADRYRAALRAAGEAFADDLDSDALKAATTKLTAKLRAAETAAQAAETPSVLADLPGADRAAVAARWDALTTSARRAALKALAPKARLNPGSHGGRGAGRLSTPVQQRVTLWP